MQTLDERILSIAYSDGERTLKLLKKTSDWNTLPKEEKIKQFDKYLSDLKFRVTPGVEVIQPNRHGSFSFLKVTFLCGGDRKAFVKLNKIRPNKI